MNSTQPMRCPRHEASEDPRLLCLQVFQTDFSSPSLTTTVSYCCVRDIDDSCPSGTYLMPGPGSTHQTTESQAA